VRICILALILSCLLLLQFSPSVIADYRPAVSTIEHPEISGQTIYGIAGKNGLRAIALRNKIFIERQDGNTEIFDHSSSPLLEGGTITAVEISEDDLWVAQSAPSQNPGILHFSNGIWNSYKQPDAPGLLNNNIRAIHADQDDSIWIGHKREGVSHYIESVNPVFKNTKIMHFYDFDLLALHMQITHLWAGSSNGIIRYRSEIKSNYDLNIDKWVFPEFPAREAFCIAEYTDNRIFAGTSRGLAVFADNKWSLLGRSEGITALPVMFIQRSGPYLWLGSPAGLQLWNETGETLFLTEEHGLPSRVITALATDENGNLLVGTEKGAAIIAAPR